MPSTKVRARELHVTSSLHCDTEDERRWGKGCLAHACAPCPPPRPKWALLPPQEINLQKDWKLITLFIGSNDLCHYCDNEVGP